MTLSALDDIAQRYGIALEYEGTDGKRVPVPDRTKRQLLSALGACLDSPAALAATRREALTMKPPVLRTAAGKRCYLPSWLDAQRAWGISLQLYELRSKQNWGIGDFADLAAVCRVAGRLGADFIGTNPLHALFTAEPARCSPFSPSNRLFLNPLYIALPLVPGYQHEDADPRRLSELRALDLVDYEAVREVKFAALRRAWARWREDRDSSPSHQAFSDFRAARGEALRKHTLFEALSWDFASRGLGAGWRGWPAECQEPDSPEVRSFETRHSEEVGFHCWLQWLADHQLSLAAGAARKSGMRIGLYLDLAVGEAPDGSATWGDRLQLVSGMSIGAPPDYFSANGQDWGLTPLSPLAMQKAGFARYRELVQGLTRHAGALRIDHVMSLWQLFFVPDGRVPAEGAYVRYPIEQLLGILAEESLRHRTVVIGEDLGAVPPGFREVMQQAGILSYRVLYFEQKDDKPVPPQRYPRLALACLSTHDLPTIAGWWSGDDIELRLELGLIEEGDVETQRAERARFRSALLELLASSGALGKDRAAAGEEEREGPQVPLSAGLVAAIHRLIASTPSLLASVRLADVMGVRHPTNVPGTSDGYPNWRLKLPRTIDEIADLELGRSVFGAMAEERPRQP